MARQMSDESREHRAMAVRYGVHPQTLRDWGINPDTAVGVVIDILSQRLGKNDETAAAIIAQSAAMEKDKVRFEEFLSEGDGSHE